MGNQNFDEIRLLLVVCIFINELHIIYGNLDNTIEPWWNLQLPSTPPPPPPPKDSFIEPWNQPLPNTPPPAPSSPCQKDSPINVKYNTESPGGELIIKFSYDEDVDDHGKMNVLISYDTGTAPAETFFKNQFTDEIFQGFNKCGVIKWDIVPCSNSKMKDGQLYCPQGVEQCEFDKIHACAENLYKDDPQKMALFVICFFNQENNCQQCATESGMIYDDMWKCASGDQGANFCDLCHRHSQDKVAKKKLPSSTVTGGAPSNPPVGTPTLDPTGSANSGDAINPAGIMGPVGATENLDGIADFKGALCAKLAEGQLKCDFCSC